MTRRASFVFGRRHGSSVGLGQAVGPTIGDAQERGDQQERSYDEQHLVPTALMCEDHPDDRTVWGNISRVQAVLNERTRDTNQERREHPCPR